MLIALIILVSFIFIIVAFFTAKLYFRKSTQVLNTKNITIKEMHSIFMKTCQELHKGNIKYRKLDYKLRLALKDLNCIMPKEVISYSVIRDTRYAIMRFTVLLWTGSKSETVWKFHNVTGNVIDIDNLVNKGAK